MLNCSFKGSFLTCKIICTRTAFCNVLLEVEIIIDIYSYTTYNYNIDVTFFLKEKFMTTSIGCNKKNIIKSDDYIQNFVREIKYDSIGKHKPKITIEYVSPEIVRFNLSFVLSKAISQDDWQLCLTPSFIPNFCWAPHLTPTKNNVIDQHSFRSPALIVHDNNMIISMIPDLDIMLKGTHVGWYMDLDAQENNLVLGMSNTDVEGHVLFKRRPGAFYPAGSLEVGFYLILNKREDSIFNPWRETLKFHWNNYGKKIYNSEQVIRGSLDHYVNYTYEWAFNRWEKNVWQEFELEGKRVGAPCFIVNVTQSPNYQGIVNEREFRSIWNQVWFSSLRSAYGLYLYGEHTNNKELINRALMTKELALSFPQNSGIFPSIICTEMETIEIDERKVNRSTGWNTFYWGNCNRNPYTIDPKKSPYSTLNMSWTSLIMIRWYKELESDERLLDYAINYSEALIKLQDDEGFFPTWLDKDTLQPLDILNHSPMSSLSVTFLLQLYNLTNENRYLLSAMKAMDAVIKNIISEGQWEDFETYWSCSTYGNEELVGKKIKRNNMYKQCNFSMFWTAEALYYSYTITKNEKYLKLGQRCLDEMLMTQASWMPPYIPLSTLGGFGVMNCDGEWNDARQSLFAEIIVQYGIELGNDEYIQRGLAAMRASFIMMYCPENKRVKEQWEKKWPFFNEKDYGFMMENYGHDGKVNTDGTGMGEFTIYDWGNGAAAESYMRMLKHYGKEFVINN